MNHRDIVGWGFCIGGALLGLPSLAGLVLVGGNLLFAPPAAPDKPGMLDVGTYGIAGLIANGAKGVVSLFDWLGGIATWVEGALVVVLAMAFAVAVVIVLTGRGILRHAAAASGWGIALSVAFALFWLVVLLAMNRSAQMAVPAMGLAMAGYAVWVLGWR